MTVDLGWSRSVGYLVAARYRLVRRLGSGGTGVVWLANDERLRREVAVKQVLASAGSAQDQQHRFLREGRIAASFAHPHSIAMYDVVFDSGQPWLVMEYLPSRSLADVLGIQRTLPVVRVAQVGAQLADALAAAHDVGVVHRDVKPANVLIDDNAHGRPTAKITDFGISRARGDAGPEEAGLITGTPAYLAPEVARGRVATESSDVFALGATLFTAVEGAPPFGTDDDTGALLQRVAGGEIAPPRRAGALTPVLLWMLEADPRQRPSMVQARDELIRLAAGRGDDIATTERAAHPRAVRTKHRPGAKGVRSRLRRPAARKSPFGPGRRRDRAGVGQPSQRIHRRIRLSAAWQNRHRLVPAVAFRARAGLRRLHLILVRAVPGSRLSALLPRSDR